MSTKFEQLLDLLVNEEMDKANELFHEIVVEKSREIYENMIAEEADTDDMEEAMDSEDGEGDDKKVDEETTLEIGGDMGDDFVDSVSDMGDDDMDMDPEAGNDGMDGDLGGAGDGSDEERISDLEDALEELKAEFEALMADEEGEEAHNDGEEDPDFDSETDDEEEGEDDEDKMAERMITREYVEKVSDGHGVEKKGKPEAADNTRSPVSSASGRPTTSASAHNILGGKAGEAGIKGGEGLVGGIKGEYTKDHLNKPGGFKGDAFKKNAAGHGAEKKGTGEGQAYTKSPADRRQ